MKIDYLEQAVKFSEISKMLLENVDELDRVIREAKEANAYNVLNDLLDDKTTLIKAVSESYNTSVLCLKLRRKPNDSILTVKALYHAIKMRLLIIRHNLMYRFYIKKHLE